MTHQQNFILFNILSNIVQFVDKLDKNISVLSGLYLVIAF